MANISVTWTGASRLQYKFAVFPVGTLFNRVSGVYIACKQTFFAEFEALYVGETKSFYDRLNAGAETHDGLRRAAQNGMTHIGAIVILGDAERLRVETDLRHGLNPLCNAQGTNALSALWFQK
jgi:hypothetical protein